MGTETFLCELCKLDYSSRSQFEEHFWSMIHHKQLETTYGVGKMHVCCLCMEQSDSISGYAKHLIGPKHRAANDERRKQKRMQVAGMSNPQSSHISNRPQTQDVSYDIQTLTSKADLFTGTAAGPGKLIQCQWDQPNSQFRFWGDNYVDESNVHKSFRKSSALQWNEGNGKKYYYSGKKQWIAKNDYHLHRSQPYSVPDKRIVSNCSVTGKDNIPAKGCGESSALPVEKEKGTCQKEPGRSVSTCSSNSQIPANKLSPSQNSAVKDKAKSSSNTTQEATLGSLATAKVHVSTSSESHRKIGQCNSVGQTKTQKSASRNEIPKNIGTSRFKQSQGSLSKGSPAAAPKAFDRPTSGASSKERIEQRHNIAERSVASSDKVNQRSVSESESGQSSSSNVVTHSVTNKLVTPIRDTNKSKNVTIESRPASAPGTTQTVKSAIANHILLKSTSVPGSSSSFKLPPKVTRLHKTLPKSHSESGCKDSTNDPIASAAAVGTKLSSDHPDVLENEASVTRIQLPPSLQRELTKLLVKSQGPRPKPNLAAARSRLHTGEHHQAQVVESPDRMVQQLLMKLLDSPKSRDRQIQQIEELKHLVQTSKKGSERARFAIQQLPEVSLQALESLLKSGQLKPLSDKDDNIITSFNRDQQTVSAPVQDLETYKDILRASDFGNSDQGNLAVPSSSQHVDSKEGLQPLLKSSSLAILPQEHLDTVVNQTHKGVDSKEPLKPLIAGSESKSSLDKLPTQTPQENTQGAEDRISSCDIRQPAVVIKTEPGTEPLQNHDASSVPSSAWASNMLVSLSVKCKEGNRLPEGIVPEKLIKVKTEPSTKASQSHVAQCDPTRPSPKSTTSTSSTSSTAGTALDVKVPDIPKKVKTEPGTLTSESSSTVLPFTTAQATDKSGTDVLVEVKTEPGVEIFEATEALCPPGLPTQALPAAPSPSQQILEPAATVSVHVNTQPPLKKESPTCTIVGAGPSRGDPGRTADNLDPQMNVPGTPKSCRAKTPIRTTPMGRRSTPRQRQPASLQEILLELSLKEEKLHKRLKTVETNMRTTKELIQKKQLHFKKLKEKKTKLSMDMLGIRTKRLQLLTDATLKSCGVASACCPENVITPPTIQISSEERLSSASDILLLSPSMDETSPSQLKPAERGSSQNSGICADSSNISLLTTGPTRAGLRSGSAGLSRTPPGTRIKTEMESTANAAFVVDPVPAATRNQSDVSQRGKRKSKEIETPPAKKAKLAKTCKPTPNQPTKSKTNGKKSFKSTRGVARNTSVESSTDSTCPTDMETPDARVLQAVCSPKPEQAVQPNTHDNPAAFAVKTEADVKHVIAASSNSDIKPEVCLSTSSLVGPDDSKVWNAPKSPNVSNYDVFEISSDSENSASKFIKSQISRVTKPGELSKLATTPQATHKLSPSKSWPPCGIFRNHNAAVLGMCLVEQTLFTVSADCTARAYDINDFSLQHSFSDHTKEVTCLATWRSRASNEIYLFTGSSDHKIIVYNTKTFEHKASLCCDGQVSCLDVQDDYLYAGLVSGSVHIIDLKSLGLERTLQCKTNCKIESMISGKCKGQVQLVIGYEDWTIGVHDIKHGKLLRSFLGHNGSIVCLVIFHSLLYSASSDGTILVHDWIANQRVKTMNVYDDGVTAMLVKKKCVITASLDGKIRQLNRKGKVKWIIADFTHKLLCMTCTHKTLYVGCSDGTVQAVHLKSEEEIEAQVRTLPPCLWSGCGHYLNPKSMYLHLKGKHFKRSKQCKWHGCTTMLVSASGQQLNEHAQAHVNNVCKQKKLWKFTTKKKKKRRLKETPNGNTQCQTQKS